jgi:acetoin utilization protein AcuB
MKARDVMTPKPVTVSPQTSLAQVWDLMREADIRHVPVVEGGVLVGMVSDRDLTAVDVARLLAVEGADALQRELATPVVRIMSSDVLSVELETDLGEVIDLMVEGKVGAIPVVRPDTREVVGIISYVDLLRAARELVSEEG